jgi:cell division septal protein FtsQ
MRLKLSFKQFLPKKSHLKKTGAVLLVGVFTVLVCIGIVFLNSYFSVKTIIINQPKNISLKGVTELQKENILLLNEKEAAKIIYKQNPNIKSVELTKELPSTLHINVVLEKEAAYLEIIDGYFVLGEDGRILKKIKDKEHNIAVIHYYQKFNNDAYRTGEKMSFKDIQAAIFFLKSVQQLNFTINSIDITGFNMIALNTDSQKLLFTIEKSQTDQVYQLGRVVEQIKMQKKIFKTIDLRFDRVIIEN